MPSVLWIKVLRLYMCNAPHWTHHVQAKAQNLGAFGGGVGGGVVVKGVVGLGTGVSGSLGSVGCAGAGNAAGAATMGKAPDEAMCNVGVRTGVGSSGNAGGVELAAGLGSGSTAGVTGLAAVLVVGAETPQETPGLAGGFVSAGGAGVAGGFVGTWVAGEFVGAGVAGGFVGKTGPASTSSLARLVREPPDALPVLGMRDVYHGICDLASPYNNTRAALEAQPGVESLQARAVSHRVQAHMPLRRSKSFKLNLQPMYALYIIMVRYTLQTK